MKLLVRRSHRPGLFHKVIYTLDLRAQLTEEERATVSAYGLTDMGLYARSELADGGRGLLGLLHRMAFGATNLTVRVSDLLEGKRVESPSILVILSMEDEITAASRTFNQVLVAASTYDGDQVVEL